MTARAILIILRKELLDGLRDKRALWAALVLPLLGPALIAGMMSSIADDVDTRAALEMPFAGTEHAPALVAFLRSEGVIIVEAPQDPERAVRRGEVSLVVRASPTFAERQQAVQPATIELIVDGSRTASRVDVTRAKTILGSWGSNIVLSRLLARGIEPTILTPMVVDVVDTATPEKKAANFLEMIVMFMLVAPFIGSMYLSMDTTAGERERKSLEPLLSLPVSRSAITLGKFAAATLFAVAACLLTTATIVLTISQVPLELLGVRVQLTPAALSRLVVCTLPLCPLAAALQLAIASVTKSIKEAQTWTSITLFMPMVPGMILTMRPVNPESWMNVVPILSQQLLARASLSGEPLPIADFSASLAACLLCTGVLLAIMTQQFSSERILRR